MSEQKHTPGPWAVEIAHGSSAPFEIWARGSQSFTIALLNGRMSPEIEANARLIAAAPEMFDLAKNVGGFDDRLLTSADLGLLRATLIEFRDQARAAIDKATGSQP